MSRLSSPSVSRRWSTRSRISGRIRLPRWAAILTVYLVFLTIVITIAMLIVPPLVSQASDLWTAAPDLLHRAQQWLIQRGLLSREITMLEAVQQAPVGGSDAVGTVFAAVWDSSAACSAC